MEKSQRSNNSWTAALQIGSAQYDPLETLLSPQRAQNFPSKCSKTSSSVGGLCCAAITGFLGWKYLCYKRSVWPTLRVVCVAYTSSVGKPKPSPVTDPPPRPSILSPVLSSTGVNHYHRRDRFTMGGSATVAYQKPPWEMFWPTARAQRWTWVAWRPVQDTSLRAASVVAPACKGQHLDSRAPSWNQLETRLFAARDNPHG